MKIISHRGLWETNVEKNTLKAFRNSLSQGFGLETDIRDLNGQLVISHDMPKQGVLTAEEFFQEYNKYPGDLTLALNVKADGMQEELARLLTKYNISNYFCFDASVPDTLIYLKSGLNVFTRQSEYEITPSFYEEAKGLWLDCFQSEWYDAELIQNHLNKGKKVCVVSPELHGRSQHAFWERLGKMKAACNDDLILCTDNPLLARRLLNGKN